MVRLFSISRRKIVAACLYCLRTKVLWSGNLGRTQSCGCVTSVLRSRAQTTHGDTIGKKTPEYKAWLGMKERCYNKNHTNYKDWGGRGIKVCKRWINSFPNFLKDMGRKPKGTLLDRINNNGNYTPKNCRWATMQQSNKNRRKFRRAAK